MASAAPTPPRVLHVQIAALVTAALRTDTVEALPITVLLLTATPTLVCVMIYPQTVLAEQVALLVQISALAADLVTAAPSTAIAEPVLFGVHL